ncbi:hypothetical protein LASUN_23700 [Lentilactobacillus sunkii]|jgi:LPXTG-motif cell wall-anchored protein|uniref:Gram-positive cocci surface proteins LPxTG domain-containing protein n=1 Tax=Lentilactobacillus sunkii TaxID=481719 RepID=A0A1E7XA68_9LACO|nr:KxYKxGKxW signal peptide domain-containing protein [Lentilactobacillus sunkii]OFA09888.1 hypothetical protein LASUN_23700 [Lentilactobacillus sunkii]
MQQKTVDQKVRFKMYKAGKRWLISGTAVVGAAIGLIGSVINVSASQVENEIPSAQKSSSANEATPSFPTANSTALGIKNQASTSTESTSENGQVKLNEQVTTNQSTVADSTATNNETATSQAAVSNKGQHTNQPVIDSRNQVAEKILKTGDQVKDINVVKAVDPADKTENPTINPKEHTDETDTNYYPGTKIKQAPIYVDGKLANPPGKDAISNGDKIGSDDGPINRSEWMKPVHENEVINHGFYNGTNLFMTGWADDNSSIYLYTYDKNKQLIKTERFEGPNSAKFDSNWSFTDKNRDLKVFWQYGYLQMQVVSSSRVAFVSAPQYIDKIPVKFVDKFGNAIAKENTTGGYANTFVNIDVPHIDGYRLIQVPYMNNDHKFLITNQEKTVPTTEWSYTQQTNSTGRGQRVIDERNTQEVYLTFGNEKSKIFTLKAIPNAFLGQSFKRGWIMVDMPQPVGNPLTFVYEPIAEYKLAVNYLEEGTGRVMHVPYTASGAGTYEISSPEFYNYTASVGTAKGILSKDTTIDVYYKLKEGEPAKPNKPIIPVKPIIVIPVIPQTPVKPTNPTVPDPPVAPATPTPIVSVTAKTPAPTPDPTYPEPAIETINIDHDQPEKADASPDKLKIQTVPKNTVKNATNSPESQSAGSNKVVNVGHSKASKTVNGSLNNRILPQTGDYKSTQLTIVGSVLLAITALIGGLIFKKRKD